jgi:hypothetical protein
MDRTAIAVRRTITALGADRYEVGVKDLSKPGMTLVPYVAEQLEHSISYWRARNAEGMSIYIRPHRDDPSPLVLVDDVSRAAIGQMACDGLTPALVVETSPGNFQAWVKLPEPLSVAERGDAARLLAERYGGDPGSTDGAHFGRLPGYTNAKPEHRRADGLAPYVLVHQHSGQVAPEGWILVAEARLQRQVDAACRKRLEAIPQPTQWPDRDADQAATWYRATWQQLEQRFGTAFDASRADWLCAVGLFAQGYRYEQVAAAVGQYSPGLANRKSTPADYVTRTVGKAEIWMELQERDPKLRYADVARELLPLAQQRAAERAEQARYHALEQEMQPKPKQGPERYEGPER